MITLATGKKQESKYFIARFWPKAARYRKSERGQDQVELSVTLSLHRGMLEIWH